MTGHSTTQPEVIIPEDQTESQAKKAESVPTVPPIPMNKNTAVAIRAALIQQKQGLEEQIRGISTIIAEIEKSWGIEKKK